MTTIKITKEFGTYRVNDVVEVTSAEAVILIDGGLAAAVTDQPAAPEPPPQPAGETPDETTTEAPRRRYRSR